jgi:hypothetical protein
MGRLDFSHFVSIPISDANRQTDGRTSAGSGAEPAQCFADFREAALADPAVTAASVRRQDFSAPERLHLTLLMLKLYSNDARRLAAEVWRLFVMPYACPLVSPCLCHRYIF